MINRIANLGSVYANELKNEKYYHQSNSIISAY